MQISQKNICKKTVRYGRVPKKSREAGSCSEENMSICVNSTTPSVAQLNGGGHSTSNGMPTTTTSITTSSINGSSNTAINNNSSTPMSTSGCAEISTSTTTILPDSMTFTPPELSVYDIIQCIAQAHRGHCTYTSELVKDQNRISLLNYSEKHNLPVPVRAGKD
uniref:Uncharacterized protein n=1 Tax=Anopheles stephensi TaxID=30069 RepID=A0A182YJ80_ANOST